MTHFRRWQLSPPFELEPLEDDEPGEPPAIVRRMRVLSPDRKRFGHCLLSPEQAEDRRGLAVAIRSCRQAYRRLTAPGATG